MRGIAARAPITGERRICALRGRLTPGATSA
jgi:hypothetical protein